MRRTVVLLWAVLAVVSGPVLHAQPDPRRMSGVPLPVGDVPTGTVTVRVLRGSFANPVVSQTVEMTGVSGPLQATTDEAGRAEFTGLTPGTRLKAHATVAGQRLDSQEFTVPASGGIRLMLVSSEVDDSSPAAVAPTAGDVVIGDESRFVFELGEDGMSVYYAFQLMNRSGAPVEPRTPLVFELPEEARSTALLEGSSPQAVVAGRELRIAGPIQPGPTLVQLAYSIPYASADLVIEQRLPAPLEHVAVVAQKVGDMQLASPQIAEQRTMPAQGNLYIAGRGGPVRAGEVLRFHFTNVPHHPTWPRNVALVLAVLVLAGGVWSAFRPRGARSEVAAKRGVLEAHRDQLFEELSTLETDRGRNDDPEEYALRRRELVAALEEVYAQLDDEVALGRAS